MKFIFLPFLLLHKILILGNITLEPNSHLLFRCAPESLPANSCFKWGSWPDEDNPGWLSRPVDDEKCDIGLEIV